MYGFWSELGWTVGGIIFFWTLFVVVVFLYQVGEHFNWWEK